MSDVQARLDALLRTNFYFFLQRAFPEMHGGADLEPAPYLEAMCFRMQEAGEGRIPRLLVTIPPRHLKSICGSVALIAWLLGRDPSFKVIVACYGEELARDHAHKFRDLVKSRFYRRLFPAMRLDPKAGRWNDQRTTAGGERRAVSLGGAGTGLGADLIVIDDLMKALDANSETKREEAKAYYEQTLYSRQNDKRMGRIIAIQQRLHEDDFAGHLLGIGSFDHLTLPAIAQSEQVLPLYMRRTWSRRIGDLLNPIREPQPVLDVMRAEMGAYAFSAQYLQDPVPVESEHLRLEKMTLIETAPAREDVFWVVQSWDTAIKDKPGCDYSVCTTWGWDGARWVLLDVLRERLDFPALKQAATRLHKTWRPDKVMVEDSSNGTALVQALRQEGMLEFQYVKPHGDKFERFIVQTDLLQSDRVAFPTSPAWFEPLKKELLVFPNGRHDDQVDSITQFLRWARSDPGLGFVDRDPKTGRPLHNLRNQRARELKAARGPRAR